MSFLRKLSASLSTPAPKAAVDRHLAMAVLLLETARADFERGPDELELIREQLAHGLKLDAAQTEALIARATDSAGTEVSPHEFWVVMNTELEPDGKRELLAVQGRVAVVAGAMKR